MVVMLRLRTASCWCCLSVTNALPIALLLLFCFSLSLLFLSQEGTIVYSGPVTAMARHYARGGFPVPPNTNLADHALFTIMLHSETDLRASGMFMKSPGARGRKKGRGVGNAAADPTSLTATSIAANSFVEITELPQVQEAGEDEGREIQMVDVELGDEDDDADGEYSDDKGSTYSSESDARIDTSGSESTATVKMFTSSNGDDAGGQKPGFWVQLKWLSWREWNTLRRDTGALVGRFGVTIFLNLIFGLVFLNAGKQDDSLEVNLRNHFGALTIVTINTLFGR